MTGQLRIACVGGGPAGLYFAISAKLRQPGHEITVVERNPAGVTHGWGVGYWDDVLDSLYRNDPVSAREIQRSTGVWDGVEVHIGADHGCSTFWPSVPLTSVLTSASNKKSQICQNSPTPT
jgi:2-polyprenyl-6-methoxyphenol hydroxylase-like FAD-dependent oxidoreductase